MSVFAITILLTGTITPALLIQEADAIKSKGTSLSEINSNKVCGDTLCSAGINPTLPAGVTMQSDKTTPDVELLFVQSSVSGTFDDGEKTLTLVGISSATVYFSDRPNRITGFEDTEQFIGMWSEGEDSFASDPPNAVLEMHGSDGQSDVFILELLNPIYDSKAETLQYTVEILAEASDGLTQYDDRHDLEIPATFEDAVLFIDSFNLGKEMKKIFIDEPQQGDERPATILPDIPLPTPWHIVNKGGDVIGGAAQHEYQKILQSIDVGDWEENAIKNSIKMRMLSAHAGGNIGEKIGGERGKQIGARAGDAIGQAMAATITKTLSSGKIDDNSVIDNMDVANLITNLQNIVSDTASNFQIAYTLTDNMLKAEGQNISDSFLTSMDKLGQESALAAAYDADNFCGGNSNDEFFENVLSKVFLHYLRLTIEAWILDDLNNGMTYDQIQADLDANMENTVRLVILYTFWGLQDVCLTDSDNDMYSLIFNQLFIPDNTTGPIVDMPWAPPAMTTTMPPQPSGVYPGHYPRLEVKDPPSSIRGSEPEESYSLGSDTYYPGDPLDTPQGGKYQFAEDFTESGSFIADDGEFVTLEQAYGTWTGNAIEEEPPVNPSSEILDVLDDVVLDSSTNMLRNWDTQERLYKLRSNYNSLTQDTIDTPGSEMPTDVIDGVADEIAETMAKDFVE